MKTIPFLFAASLAFLTSQVTAQNIFPSSGSAGIGTTLPNSAALLEMISTSKGLLIPRMTKNQRDAISTPATGLLIYQTNNNPGFYFYDGSAWTAVSSKDANKSLSNLNSPTEVNVSLLPQADNTSDLGSGLNTWKNLYLSHAVYLGLEPQRFLSQGNSEFNTYAGTNAGTEGSVGTANTAIGNHSGSSATTGAANTSIGASTLRNNESGSYNVIAGYNAALQNISGSNNVAIGTATLQYNKIVSGLVAIGDSALYTNALNALSSADGRENTAVGAKALMKNDVGVANTAIGNKTLMRNSIGVYNTAVGNAALFANDVGGYNTAMGSFAMSSNTSGYSNTAAGDVSLTSNSNGNNNAAFGAAALHDNVTGSSNTAMGSGSLFSNIHGYSNVAVGIDALHDNVDAMHNVALGDSALYHTSSDYFAELRGWNNTGVGSKSLYSNVGGEYNTAVGSQALYSNDDGVGNTAVGFEVLRSNLSSFGNTGIGYRALKNNSSGSNNTGVGTYALGSVSTGNNNTGVGIYALSSNSRGYSNSALGVSALYRNTDRSNLVAIGDSALYNNGTGATSAVHSSLNVAVGSKSLYSNTTGYYNTATGYQSAYKNTTGYQNIAYGYQALFNNTTGYHNTAVGRGSMVSNTSGFDNVAIGYSAGSLNDLDTACTFIGTDADQGVTTNFYNSMALGHLSRIIENNYIAIGNTGIKKIQGQVNFTTFSDGRFKKEVKENVPGLSFINKLKAVTYKLDVSGISKVLHEDITDGDDNSEAKKATEKLMDKARKEKEKITYTGFIAQDVEKASKELNYDFSGVDIPANKNESYGLRYAEFVVPLVKAVQELSNKNDQLQQQIDELKSMMQALSINNIATSAVNKNTKANAGLEQNIPNPFSSSTSIRYHLSASVSNAQLVVTNTAGNTVKTFTLSSTAAGSVIIHANELAAGSYYYTLIIDGKKSESKQMILLK